MTENEKIVKRYINKFFREQFINKNDQEFKTLVRILNKKDKEYNK